MNDKQQKLHYTEQDILNDLDDANDYNKFFMDIEHGYLHTAGNRITLFADKTRWAIVLEQTGYHNPSFSCLVEIFYFGNCLINLPIMENYNDHYNYLTYTLIDKQEIDLLKDKFLLLNTNIRDIKVRDTLLSIEQNADIYEKNNIRLKNYPLIDVPNLIRYLDEHNPELFRATDDELKTCLPKDLPKLMVIDEWHYRFYDIYSIPKQGNKPSSYETFRLIAKILVTKDTSLWKPTLQPNNNWRNYPDAGKL
jgi:hypothetical protein